MNTNPIAVITAKAKSTRLPGKNMLPLGNMPLAMWSVAAARQAGLDTVVSTDIPVLKEMAAQNGCRVVHQNILTESGQERTHKDVILAALQETNNADRPVVLLQPTSPFRYGGILKRCWLRFLENNQAATVLTTHVVHDAQIKESALANSGESRTLWDGCVAIYPAGRVCEYSPVVSVRNQHINSLQIDTEDDYINACTAAETYKPVRTVLPQHVYNLLSPVIRRAGIGGHVTIVGRGTGEPIPQAHPVIYLNHCLGYDGQRCDGLVLIANEHIKQVGIGKELRECANKAKFVIVRHNGELNWLLQSLPEIGDKFYPIRDIIGQLDDHLTTGCIAADMFAMCGCKVNFVGLYAPHTAIHTLTSFHYPALSREIALFDHAGVYA